MKKIGLYLAMLMLWAVPGYAADAPSNPDPFHDWLAYYYLNKDAAKVPDFIKWVQESAVLEKHPGAAGVIEGFLSVVFADNPDKAAGWSGAAPLTGKAREAIDYALKPPVTPETKEVKNPGDIDMMWGAFFASGKEVYLGKIADALDESKPLTGNAATDATTHAAAAWSLGSNMTQHESVERFLDSESGKRPGAVGEKLRNIAADVRKQREARAFPHRDGEFSALMSVVDPAVAAKEFAKPSGDVVHLKEARRAKIGDKRTILLVFAGMQLTPDYLADVTYDVRLTDPAGKVYSDHKDLEAIKQKVPTRFRVFNNKQVVFLSFERKDKPGIYKIDVILKDNIGKKTIPLDGKITLRK